jgi:hypothetical protein
MINSAQHRLLLAALFAIVLIGCGTPEQAVPLAETQTREATPAPAVRPTALQVPTVALATVRPAATAAPTTAAAQRTPAAAASPLKRRDPPPPGVPAELPQLYGGGGFGCQALPDASLGLRITIYETDREVADGFSFCFSGFVKDQPLQVEVARPDGALWHGSVPADPRFGPEALSWVTLPGDPLGTYRVTATQGDKQARSSFTLRAASARHIVVFPQDRRLIGADLPAGAAIQVALAGFQPDQRVALYLYALTTEPNCATVPPTCWVYRAALPPSQMDALGQAVATLLTQPDDPDGTYRIVPEPVDSSGEFGFGLDTFSIAHTAP